MDFNILAGELGKVFFGIDQDGPSTAAHWAIEPGFQGIFVTLYSHVLVLFITWSIDKSKQ